MNSGSELVVPYGSSAARVLGLLRLAGEDGASRSELAVRTGLTPQAVSKITARLRSHGLVTEAGRRASTGGKPSTVLRLSPGARHAVGIQLDRDQLTAILVDLSGSVVAGRTAPLDLGAGADAVLDAVESAVFGLIGAGLPTLGVGASRAATAEGATGGELWQQASAGEVWTSRHPAHTAEAPREDRSSEMRQAVSEEGELWEGTGGDAEKAEKAEKTEQNEKTEQEQAEQSGHAGETADTPAGQDADLEEGRTAVPEPAPGHAAPVAELRAGAVPEAEAGAGASAEGEPGAREDEPDVAGRWGSVLGVGVAAPGPLDHARGVLHHVTGHPRWAGYPLRDALVQRLGMPVVIDKDTNAAALGLALRGRESLAYLHLGTGLGAGLVLEGRIHRGRRNGAGEFGHQVLQLDGPPCRCGKHGCAEALCLEAVRRGDTREAARVLGVAAANLVNLLDVDRVLLGGRTVLAAPDTFVDGVAEQLRGTPAGLEDGRDEDGTAESGRGGVRVELVPEGARTVADGAAQLVLAPLFGRVHGAQPGRPG